MKAQVETEVRRRVADALSSAGVPATRVANEILYFLPPSFVREYARLFHQAYDLQDTVSVGDENKAGQGKGRGRSADRVKGMVPGEEPWPVRSEKALEKKHQVDKKLRRIMRDARDGVKEQRVSGGTRCGACGRFIQREWSFCPRCGHDRRQG